MGIKDMREDDMIDVTSQCTEELALIIQNDEGHYNEIQNYIRNGLGLVNYLSSMKELFIATPEQWDVLEELYNNESWEFYGE